MTTLILPKDHLIVMHLQIYYLKLIIINFLKRSLCMLKFRCFACEIDHHYVFAARCSFFSLYHM